MYDTFDAEWASLCRNSVKTSYLCWSWLETLELTDTNVCLKAVLVTRDHQGGFQPLAHPSLAIKVWTPSVTESKTKSHLENSPHYLHWYYEQNVNNCFQYFNLQGHWGSINLPKLDILTAVLFVCFSKTFIDKLWLLWTDFPGLFPVCFSEQITHSVPNWYLICA